MEELFKEGQIIRGTYEVERLLGEGAFGKVYRVRHKFLGHQSMKVFKAQGMTPEEIEKVLEEPVMLSKLLHPNIIRVFDADTTETPVGICGYFTMEYVAGGSLKAFWQSHGRNLMPVETVVEIARQICRGLAVAHGQNPPIVHRDIKPENILVGYDGEGLRVRVSDFGLAKHANPLTMQLSAKGTPWFKAPEVFIGPKKDMDSASGDVYGVGSTLYLLLSDQLPYEFAKGSDKRDAFNVERFESDLVPLSKYNREVDAALERIVARSLAKSPKDRYPSAKEFLADLEAWKPGTPSAGKDDTLSSSAFRKDALGVHSSADEEEARELAKKAVALARDPGKLAEAANVLEQALNAWPPLREDYEYRLKLWRRGMVM